MRSACRLVGYSRIAWRGHWFAKGNRSVAATVVFSYTDSCTYIHIHIYAEYVLTQWITTSEVFFIKIGTSHFIVRVTQGFMVSGSWRPDRTAIFWPPLLWLSALCLSRSPGLLNRRPRGPLRWLSLPHLISNFSGPQLIRGPWRPLQPGVAFRNTSYLQLQL